MIRKTLLTLFIVFGFFFTFFITTPPLVHASFLDDIFNGVKNLFSQPKLTIASSIALAPGGDLNKNGQIDSGDTVKFSYTVINPTKNTYQFSELKTNTDMKTINGITNVQGILSLDDNNGKITFPNINIAPNQVRKISFEARINFSKDSDLTVNTEPELADRNNNSIFKADKQEIVAKKMDTETFNKFVQISK